MSSLSRALPLLALALPGLAMADAPQLYRWTDSQGVLHYSDQPPVNPAADLTAAAMPSFPPVDEAALAQRQAALLAEVAALQRLTQAQLDQQAQAAALAQQRGELQAAAEAQQEPAPAEPIYVSSAFVPRVYRANLYVSGSHRIRAPHPPAPRPLPVKSPGSLPVKP